MVANIQNIAIGTIQPMTAAQGPGRTGRDTLDESLIERIATGDELAMRVLYTRHNVRVYRFALRILRDEAMSEDIVSEVFFDVWKKAHSYAGRSQVSTWLLAIARNKAVETFRRRPVEALEKDACEFIEDTGDTPEVAMRKSQNSSILRSCLSRLSAQHREIVDLVYYHEKSIDEVADIIHVPRNTVKTRMFYARKRLEELLAAEGLNAADSLHAM